MSWKRVTWVAFIVAVLGALGSYACTDGPYRYAALLYESEASVEEIAAHCRKQMPRENWMPQQTITADQTVLRFVKSRPGRQHCDIAIGKPDPLGRRGVVVMVMGAHQP